MEYIKNELYYCHYFVLNSKIHKHWFISVFEFIGRKTATSLVGEHLDWHKAPLRLLQKDLIFELWFEMRLQATQQKKSMLLDSVVWIIIQTNSVEFSFRSTE